MSRLSPSTQVKITLPEQLYFFLKSKADKFDLPVSSYIRNLVINDVKDLNFPTFRMSEKREKLGLEALKEHEQGKTTKVENVGEYFNNL